MGLATNNRAFSLRKILIIACAFFFYTEAEAQGGRISLFDYGNQRYLIKTMIEELHIRGDGKKEALFSKMSSAFKNAMDPNIRPEVFQRSIEILVETLNSLDIKSQEVSQVLNGVYVERSNTAEIAALNSIAESIRDLMGVSPPPGPPVVVTTEPATVVERPNLELQGLREQLSQSNAEINGLRRNLLRDSFEMAALKEKQQADSAEIAKLNADMFKRDSEANQSIKELAKKRFLKKIELANQELRFSGKKKGKQIGLLSYTLKNISNTISYVSINKEQVLLNVDSIRVSIRNSKVFAEEEETNSINLNYVSDNEEKTTVLHIPKNGKTEDIDVLGISLIDKKPRLKESNNYCLEFDIEIYTNDNKQPYVKQTKCTPFTVVD